MRKFNQTVFADRLRRARRARGLSQVGLAAAVGVCADQLACWERGKHLPRTDLLVVLALTLDLDVEWLLFGAADRGPRLC